MAGELARQHLPRTEVMTARVHEKARLVAELHRLRDRGEISPNWDLRPYAHGWAVKVVRLKEAPTPRPPRPRWVKPVLILAAVLIVLAAVIGLAWWAVTVLLAALAGVLTNGWVLLAILALVMLLGGGGGAITVIQKVTIKR